MKKLNRRGKVHPSPPPTTLTDHLSFLPATVLTLAAALSPEDREVLAYLISCSTNDFGNFSSHRKNTQKHQTKRSTSINSSSGRDDHPPLFSCDCFRCYMSYWVRWDSSPNRQLIHEIIDAFEDKLAQSQSNKAKSSKKDRKKKSGGAADASGGLKRRDLSLRKDNSSESKSVEESSTSGGEVDGDGGEEGNESGSVRRFVNLIGQRIWNVWGQ
ncbi:hypothetical protein PTKIN_Ptkin13bG0172300 [Pterospermum kingtungense]